MKKQLMIDRGGATVLANSILSCGSETCIEVVRRLQAVTDPVALSEVGADKDGNWFLPAFERLSWYAADNGVSLLDTFQVARYFGGDIHVAIFSRIAEKTRFGRDFGKDVGLVTHMLLPLTDGKYVNGEHIVEFADVVRLSEKSQHPAFYHLGLVMEIPLTEDQVQEILDIQAKNLDLVRALGRIKEPIPLPKNYRFALNCTVETATK